MIGFLQISMTSTGGLVIVDLGYTQSTSMTIAVIYSTVLDQSHLCVDSIPSALGLSGEASYLQWVPTIIMDSTQSIQCTQHCRHVQNHIILSQSHMTSLVDQWRIIGILIQ